MNIYSLFLFRFFIHVINEKTCLCFIAWVLFSVVILVDLIDLLYLQITDALSMITSSVHRKGQQTASLLLVFYSIKNLRRLQRLWTAKTTELINNIEWMCIQPSTFANDCWLGINTYQSSADITAHLKKEVVSVDTMDFSFKEKTSPFIGIFGLQRQAARFGK